jgi:asparagine synthase (glutamine-hydrolysing)
MCGIAGYIGTHPPAEDRIRSALADLHHRGPDGRGIHRGRLGQRTVLLLHTRLKIIDLDPRADQPFRDGPRTIAFNGELYNYLELRRELAAAGEAFRTESDTEVFLKALGRWGDAALDRCEGMWAFAALDEASGALTLGRDRFGEKPLFLHRATHGLYFASEPKAIFSLLGRRLPPNLDQVRRYLVNGYRSLHKRSETFFGGLERLAAGTRLAVDAEGRETTSHYWRPAFCPNEALSFPESVARVRDALVESVGLRLRADVPLAFCMSGGVDSNSLIAIAKKVFGYDVHGFTIVNTDSRYEEQDMVDCAVKALGIRHTAIPLDKAEFLENLDRQVRLHDSPVTTITFHLHARLIEQVAAHGYKISISGTAADELFTGYFDHHNAYLAAIHADALLFDQRLAEWQSHVRPLLRNPLLQNPRLWIDDPDNRAHLYFGAEEFESYLIAPWHEAFAEDAFCADPLRNRMLNEVVQETVPAYLHEDDLNAMGSSIENRSPFLDRRLFELCYSIPTRHLIGGGCAKKVLREAMRGIVADPILDNPRKVGFNAPILELLDVADPAIRSRLLDDGPIFTILKRDAVEAALAADRLPNSASKFLFSFLSARLFLDQCAHAAQ